GLPMRIFGRRRMDKRHQPQRRTPEMLPRPKTFRWRIEAIRTICLLLVSILFTVRCFCQEISFTVATLNCYWLFNGAEGKASIDKPRSTIEYSTKAGHLIGLLPR